jgi:hypothetical protein
MPMWNDKYTQNFRLQYKTKSPVRMVLNHIPQLPLALNPLTHPYTMVPNFGDR